MNSEFGQPWTAELAALDQLKKIFYLLKNYLKILACSQVSDRCPLGYLLYLMACFTLILNKLLEAPLLAHWGGQQGGVMSQIMYTEYINMGYSTHVFQINNAIITLKMQHKA